MHLGGWHLIDRDPPRPLLREWIVWWTWREGALFSRVVAGPGDRLEREAGRWLVRLADGGIAHLPPEAAFADTWSGRLLGRDEYCLLNDRLEVAEWPDSRQEGPIQRDLVVAHVLFPLGG
jgi:hypothetical protein